MNNVTFGNSGLEVNELCVGTMVFGSSCDEAESDRILSAAIERGANFLDTAEAYVHGEGEALLGRVLKGRRDQVIIATKVQSGTAPQEYSAHLDGSLKRLQTDHVDVYLVHWPNEGMEPRGIMSALNDAVVAGKTRAVGCCNFPAWLVEHCNAIAAIEGWAPLTCNQIPYNLVERGVEIEVLPQAMATNVAITVYRSLLMGILTGKYKRGQTAPDGTRAALDRKKRLDGWRDQYADALEKFDEYAADLGVTPAQLAIAWVRHCPAVTCTLAGFSSLRQVETTLAAFELNLTDDQRSEISDLFGAEVKEEAGGNYAKLRRSLNLVAGGEG
jgi:aryl-alcohol dehydrogenase-like predicted oxidoreductase